MSISLEEAKTIVLEYKQLSSAVEFDREITERANYWFFQVGYIGSSGVIVDKADGRLFEMGSAHSNEDMFWGHENGFSPEKVDLEILSVSNLDKICMHIGQILVQIDMAPSHPSNEATNIARKLLKELPFKISGASLWLQIPWFKKAVKENWFTFRVYETETNT